jgi:lipid A disaccharide synthetase
MPERHESYVAPESEPPFIPTPARLEMLQLVDLYIAVLEVDPQFVQSAGVRISHIGKSLFEEIFTDPVEAYPSAEGGLASPEMVEIR